MEWNEKQKQQQQKRFVSTLWKSLFVVLPPALSPNPVCQFILALFPIVIHTHTHAHLYRANDDNNISGTFHFWMVTVRYQNSNVWLLCGIFPIQIMKIFPSFWKRTILVDSSIVEEESISTFILWLIWIYLPLKFTFYHSPLPTLPTPISHLSINLSLTHELFSVSSLAHGFNPNFNNENKEEIFRISDQFAVAFFRNSLFKYGIRRAQYAERHIREHQSLLFFLKKKIKRMKGMNERRKEKKESGREKEKKYTQNKTNKQKLAKRDLHTHTQQRSIAAHIFCIIVLMNFTIFFVTMAFSSFSFSFNLSKNLFSSSEHFI